jgi:4-amino-4-deoxy-L-arabinose transferase-like glycosyltransferase
MQQKYGKSDKRFFLAVAVAHALFLLLTLNGDSFEYIFAAANLKNHNFFYSGHPALPLAEEHLSFRTPLYPAFLAAVYFLGGTNWTAILLQYLLSACNVLLLRRLLQRIGYSNRYDPLLLVFLLAYPAQFTHAGIIEPELPLQSLVLVYVYQLFLFYQTGKPRHAWLMTLALVGGLLAKPVLYPYVALHTLLVAVMIFRGRKRFVARLAAQLAVVAVVPLGVILAYSAWNAGRTGKFHFTSNQSVNALYYFYSYKTRTEGVTAARRFLREEQQKMAAMPAFRDRYDYANRRGKELLIQHFPGYASYHLLHSLRFLVDPGKGELDLYTGRLRYNELYHAEGRDFYSVIRNRGWWDGGREYLRHNPSVLPAMLIFLFGLVRLAGLVLFACSSQIPLGVRWFVLCFIAYFALLTGPLATPRYVLPVSLIYTGAALLGFIQWHKKRLQRQAT